MIKVAPIDLVLDVIFDALQQVALYNKYPDFKNMTKQNYINYIKNKDVIWEAYGVYKNGALIGGAYCTDQGEMHMSVLKDYIGYCMNEGLWFINRGLKIFPVIIGKIDVSNGYLLSLARKVGAKWLTNEVSNEGARIVLVLERSDNG